MKSRHAAMIALLAAGHLVFPTPGLAGQHGQDELASHRSVFDAAPATMDAAQSPLVAPRSQSGRTILKSTLIGAAVGATLTTSLAYMLRDCGNCSWSRGKAMLSGAMYGGLIGAAVGATLQRRPSPNHRVMVHSTLTPRVKAVSLQLRF
jgi:hypothetical protein